jgi:hypothetical protein
MPASLDDVVRELNLANRNMSLLITTIRNMLPRSTGTFTAANAATTTVTDSTVLSTSVILLVPTNAAAGTLQAGTTHLYVSAKTAGTSFTVATASGASAAGTETFQYAIFNPL